ncbi:hypothetical protein [Stenotrophomonas bentonitica]
MGAIIGAVVGGGFALFGIVVAWLLQLVVTWLAERKQVRAVLQAIIDEISVLESLYMHRIGAAVEMNGGQDILEIYFPILSNYFVVYDTNYGGIGRVQSAEVRKAVVETYAHLKSLADTFGYNNQLLMERQALDQQLVSSPDSEALKFLVRFKEDELRAYGAGIWQLHVAAMSAASNLKTLIGDRLRVCDVP